MEDLTERIIFKIAILKNFLFFKKQKEEMPNYLNILQIFPNQLSEKALAQPHSRELIILYKSNSKTYSASRKA